MSRTVPALFAGLSLLLSACGDKPAAPAPKKAPAKVDAPRPKPTDATKPARPAKPKPVAPVKHDLTPYGKHPVVEFKTTAGDFEVALDMEKAPQTVTAILSLCLDGFYEGVVFHRIKPGFVAQAGGKVHSRIPGRLKRKRSKRPPIPDECHNGLKNVRGAISMAKATGRLATSQFFILYKDKKKLDGIHTVFGKVTKGMDVVDGWQKLPVKPGFDKETGKPKRGDEPVDPPTITKVTVRKG